MKTINEKSKKFGVITRKKISVSLSVDSFQKLDESNISNKSAFITWLLEQYYGLNSKSK